MASTNKTTHYELSQYIGTDKPTYLTDYNQDMSKIDTGIHAAKSEADTNATSIGTLSSLTTTVKTDLVSALNEVDSDVATNTNNIATNTSNIATNTTHIGTLSNLTTTSKTDLVVASNEINAKAGNLASLNTTAKSSLVEAVNEVNNNVTNVVHSLDVEPVTHLTSTSDVTGINANISAVDLTIAKSTNLDIGKIYGDIEFTAGYSSADLKFPCNVGQTETYVISNVVVILDKTDKKVVDILNLAINDDNTAEILSSNLTNGHAYKLSLIPVILYYKDFGDTQ